MKMDDCQQFYLLLNMFNARNVIDSIMSGELEEGKLRRYRAIVSFTLWHLKTCRAHDDLREAEDECERYEFVSWINEYQFLYWETHGRGLLDLDQAAQDDPIMAVWRDHCSELAAFQLQHAEHCAEHHHEYEALKNTYELVEQGVRTIGQMVAVHRDKLVTGDAQKDAKLDNMIAELVTVRPKQDDGTEH